MEYGGVILGGILASGAGLLTQIVGAWLNEKKDYKKNRLQYMDRIYELIFVGYERWGNFLWENYIEESLEKNSSKGRYDGEYVWKTVEYIIKIHFPALDSEYQKIVKITNNTKLLYIELAKKIIDQRKSENINIDAAFCEVDFNDRNQNNLLELSVEINKFAIFARDWAVDNKILKSEKAHAF